MKIVVNDLIINYQIFNDGNKETLVFLHGWGRSLKDFLPFIKDFRKYKIVLMDLPCFGDSQTPNSNSFGIKDYATIVYNFIEKLEINKYALIEHSIGGKTACIVAANDKKCKQLILICPSGITLPNVKKILFTVFKPIKIILPNIIKVKLRSDDYKNAGELKNIFLNVIKKDIKEYLPRIEQETLIIWGEKDDQVPLKTSKIFKNNIGVLQESFV